MDFLFSIFEFLTIGAGPFFVFGGMGTGTQSGNLKFKGISATDESISITENPDHIVVSSNISPVSAPTNLVLWGTGTSVTSGFLTVDNSNRSIINIKQIGKTADLTESDNIGSQSILVRSRKAYICGNVDDSNIMFSCVATLKDARSSNIVSSYESFIDGYGYDSRSNTIIGSYQSCNKGYSQYSTILSSCGMMCRQKLGSIISSKQSTLDTQYQSCGNSTISSCTTQIIGCKTNFNSIISSIKDNYIGHFNSITLCSSYNFIGSSIGSVIKGGQPISMTYGSRNSSILSSLESYVFDGKFSSIIGSRLSRIYLYKNYGKVADPQNNYNSIIGSRSSKISNTETNEYSGFNSNFNSTISSFGSNNYASCRTAIVSSMGSKIKRSSSSAIVSSCNSTLYCSCYSAIVSSACSTISDVKSSAIVSGIQNSICSSSHYSAVINGFKNSIYCSYRSVILSGAENKIGFKSGSYDSVIVGGCKNYIQSVNTRRTSIIGGYCNLISFDTIDSQILGGSGNSLCANVTSVENSVIITGCRNNISRGANNVIIGGCCNIISPLVTIPTSNSLVLASYGSNMIGNMRSSALIGTSNVSYNSNDIYLTRVQNFIFDRCVIIPDIITGFPFYGSTGTFNPSTTSFKIRKGFITQY